MTTTKIPPFNLEGHLHALATEHLNQHSSNKENHNLL